MALDPNLIAAGAAIAGELVGAIVQGIMKGDDIEPLVSQLPPESQKNVRRILERQETLDALKEVRREVLGDEG